jgi:hypothetical protein
VIRVTRQQFRFHVELPVGTQNTNILFFVPIMGNNPIKETDPRWVQTQKMPLAHYSRDSIAAYSDDSSSETTNADQALLKEAFGGSVHRRKEVARAWRIERQNDSFQTEKKTTASCAATTSEHSHTRNIGGLFRKLHITKK